LAALLALVTSFAGARRGYAQPAPDSCDAKVAEYQGWIVKLPAPDNVLTIHDEGIGEPPDPRLVVREGRSFERNIESPSVELLTHRLRIVGDGTKVNDVAALRPLLREAAPKKSPATSAANGAPAAAAPPLLLGIDAERPWSDVVDVVNAAAEAGFTQLDFVFERAVNMTPPPSAADKAARIIRAAEPSDRGRLTAIELERILKKCAGGHTVISNMAAVGPKEMTKVLATEMPPVLRACDCAATPRDVMTLLWLWAQPDQDGIIRREYIGARVTIAKGKQPATTLKANKAAPWSETSAQVAAASATGAVPPAVRFEASSPKK
jgi:hypothetical protein